MSDSPLDFGSSLPNFEDDSTAGPTGLSSSTLQPPNAATDLATEALADEEGKSVSRKLLGYTFKFALPSWLISLVLHLAILLLMAAYSIEPISDALTKLIIDSGPVEDVSELESFEISSEDVDMSEFTEQTELAESLPQAQPQLTEVAIEIPTVAVEMGSMAEMSLESLTSQLVPSSVVGTSINAMTQGMTGRSAAAKRDLLEKFGGGSDTEKAVAMGLRWLAQHQLPDGSWSFDHTVACRGQCGNPGVFLDAKNGATGMALMAFFGAGQTHKQGDYQQNVFRGLTFLLQQMRVQKVVGVSVGSWFDDPAPGKGGRNPDQNYKMYGHGLATIAVCEAYGMTQDPQLLEAAQLGINFIVAAQDPDGGGWQYQIRTPGDTSVVGWQMMALKSAWMSRINFPDETIRRANFFLNSVQLDNGAKYLYKPREPARTNATDACGVLCRMYLGLPKNNPGIVQAVKNFQNAGPGENDCYFNYYATQVIKQFGGEEWPRWNEKMKQQLLTTQINTGHAAGSWTPAGGSGENSNFDQKGGRLYTTCMSIMVLEVYYRYLPIYHDQAEDEAFRL